MYNQNNMNIIFSLILATLISYYYQTIFNKDFIIYLISLSIIFYILFSFLNVSIEKFNTDQPTWEQKFKNYNIIYQDQNKRHNLYKNLEDENAKNEICKLINDVKKEDLYNIFIELENEANEAKNEFNINKSKLFVINYDRLKRNILNLESKINCSKSSSKNNTITKAPSKPLIPTTTTTKPRPTTTTTKPRPTTNQPNRSLKKISPTIYKWKTISGLPRNYTKGETLSSFLKQKIQENPNRYTNQFKNTGNSDEFIVYDTIDNKWVNGNSKKFHNQLIEKKKRISN